MDADGPVDVFRPGLEGPRKRRRSAALRRDADVLAVVAVGGALGTAGRYGISEWLPTRPGAFPLSTFLVNVSGCLLIGVLVVLLSDGWRPGRYARPFLGVGVLGGFTTYSTMMMELHTLGAGGNLLLADGYLLASLVAGFGAVWLGVVGAGLAISAPVRRRGQRRDRGCR